MVGNLKCPLRVDSIPSWHPIQILHPFPKIDSAALLPSLPQASSSSPWEQSGEPSHTRDTLMHIRSLQMKNPGQGGICVEPTSNTKKSCCLHHRHRVFPAGAGSAFQIDGHAILYDQMQWV